MHEDLVDVHPTRQRVVIALAAAAAVPAFAVRLLEPHLAHPIEAVVFGLAIVGAAFILSWAAEASQLDISAGLAIAALALIAVLPEYAVDFVFAFKGGNSVEQFGPSCPALEAGAESPCSLALANMTGANRLLIGVGWSLVVFIAVYRYRRGVRPTSGSSRQASRDGIVLDRQHSIELGYLALATLYSLTLPLRRSITMVDAVVLVGIFAAYTWRVARAPAEEPHLVGPARYIGTFSKVGRRTTVVALFLYAAVVIVLMAELFAEALVATGLEVGISEFLLVQWLAPLASEAPELLVAILFAWRMNTDAGLGTLVSSKVNQWTLLVGSLPIVFAIAAGEATGLPVDDRQRQELLLTAAQSFFAVAVLANLSLSLREAGALFALFWTQFIFGGFMPDHLHGVELVVVSILYLLLGVGILLRDRERVPRLFRDAFLRSQQELRSDSR